MSCDEHRVGKSNNLLLVTAFILACQGQGGKKILHKWLDFGQFIT
jgi:hypothetical protein